MLEVSLDGGNRRKRDYLPLFYMSTGYPTESFCQTFKSSARKVGVAPTASLSLWLVCLWILLKIICPSSKLSPM